MATRTITVGTPDGRTLCVESGGVVGGRAILVHDGTPNSRHLSENAVADAEDKNVHLISYDRPGYGGSTATPGLMIADCAVDVQAIAASFHIDQLAVWGISGGGAYALACAALLPDLVTRVATLASSAPYDAPGLDYFNGRGQANVDDTKLILRDPTAAREKIAVLRQEVLHLSPEQLVEAWSSLLTPTDTAALTPQLSSFLVSSMKDGLAPGDQGWWDDACAHLKPWGFIVEDIQVAVQLWHGRQDRFVPFQHGEWLAEHIPGVDAHLTEDDGHLTLTDRLPEIHDWLLDGFQ